MKKDNFTGKSDTQEYRCSIAENTVTEDAKGYCTLSLDALHLSNGRIFIDDEINMKTADHFAAAMLHLSDEQKPVDIYINSPGGEVYSGLLMYDIIQSYKFQINMYCTGTAASMAAVLLAGGQKGRRFILPHSRVMIHEPLIAGGLGGSATTIENTAKAILDIKSLVNGLIAKHTGKTEDEINEVTVHDNFMNSDEAVSFGICDGIRNIFD
ncbi:MAG: ATP-dependent Clp protease proteolytic subunit [Oscillospiraceae bacterium]|nr:ATP-dependent Clp protease proteolytic subunit [Oscillospiraceae bacterium]